MMDNIEKSIFSDLDIKELSYSSKIFLIGRYTELVLRFVLGINDKKSFQLKDGYVAFDKIEYKSFKDKYKDIVKLRNKCVHTQHYYVATNSDYNKAIKGLYYMLAFIFFRYFLEHKFGSNNSVMSCFSLLPPKIRAITLNELLKYDKENYILLEKSVMIQIKDDNVKMAYKIIENNKDYLTLQCNAYDSLKEKAKVIENFHKKIKTYEELPEAGTAYKSQRDLFLQDNTEIADFINLMDFVYKGF